ncbi:MAG: hypothetical protein ABIP93_19115 [Gemmatimonadaceae bacterium]
MLLNDLMPQFDVVERHSTLVRAPAGIVFNSIREADLAGGPVARVLLALRFVPATLAAVVRSPRAAWTEIRDRVSTRQRVVRLHDFEGAGFRVVAERAPEELVIGLLGRFWTLRGGACADVAADTFRAGPSAGLALAGWNFIVTPQPGGSSELRTETRVWCAPDVRWKFRLYWLGVRPGSGLIRHEMLRAIRRHAERQGRATGVLEDPPDV